MYEGQNPYQYQYNPYYAVRDPRKEYRSSIRRDTNRLSFGVIIALVSMTIFYFLFYFILKVVGYPFLSNTKFSNMTEEMYFLVNCLYYVLGVFLPFLIILLVSKADINETIPANKIGFLPFVLFILLGSGVCLAANIPTNYIATLISDIGLNSKIPEGPIPSSTAGIVLYAINIAIIPPLVEEFAFRGVILSRFKKYGDNFAIFTSAFLFALYHGNIVQFVFAFICGLIFGFIVIKTGNIFITIIIHAINNGFSLATELLYAKYGEDVINTVSNVSFIAIISIGLIALAVLLIKYKQYFKVSRDNTAYHSSGASKFGAAISNPGLICLFIYFTITSVQFLLMK